MLALHGAAVRVKRCGKSAPAAGATRLARQTPPGARSSRASALPSGGARADPARIGARVDCSRRRVTGVLGKWPSRTPGPMDVVRHRTRLTGPVRDQFSYFSLRAFSRDQTWSRKHLERHGWEPATVPDNQFQT